MFLLAVVTAIIEIYNVCLVISPHATDKDIVKQSQATNDVIANSTQHSVTTSQEEGHILHFSLGSLQSAGTPQIINIPNTTMTTALPAPSPLPSTSAAITSVVKATDQPVPIPYTGKCVILNPCDLACYLVDT